MIQKACRKIDWKIIKKWCQKALQNGRSSIVGGPPFWVLFRHWFFLSAKGPPGTQNERFWLPKWAPKASKMVTKTPQQTPKMQHKRPMLKSRIQILQGHSKEDLRQKGAAAVFRAACSIRRSTAGRVRHTFIHLYVFVYLSSVIIRPSLSPARDAGPSPSVL